MMNGGSSQVNFNKDIAPMPCSQLNTSMGDDVAPYEKIDIIDCTATEPKVDTIINQNGQITTITTTMAQEVPCPPPFKSNLAMRSRESSSSSDDASYQTSESVKNEANILSINSDESSVIAVGKKRKYRKSSSASIVKMHHHQDDQENKQTIKSRSSTSFKNLTRQSNHEYENQAYNFY